VCAKYTDRSCSYAPGTETLGAVSTLDLSPGLGQGALTIKSTNKECGSAPTWLDPTFKDSNNVLYCVDEGFQTPNASINTLKISADGSLKSVAKIDTIQGPVSTQFYNKNKALALAHYGGSAISTYTLSADKTTFTKLQNFTFVAKGPRPEQEASHVHEAIIDPTGEYLLFPDLGADVVRVYCADPKTSLLTVQESLKSPTASGPRHAAFWTSKGNTYLYVIHELSNVIIAYKVTYLKAGGLGFTKISEYSTYGNQPKPDGTRAAEISVSPDSRFIVASNRNATVFQIANPDPKNSTKIGSDSIATFAPKKDGTLDFVQLAPSGGSFPRHFKFNSVCNL
jgi:6-phosphogluconolactonase (cycloisomerase 2 family)